MQDLSLVPFEELYGEIAKRFDHTIFYGIKNSQRKIYDAKWRWTGSIFICIAAAVLLIDGLKEDFKKTLEPPSIEESP